MVVNVPMDETPRLKHTATSYDSFASNLVPPTPVHRSAPKLVYPPRRRSTQDAQVRVMMAECPSATGRARASTAGLVTAAEDNHGGGRVFNFGLGGGGGRGKGSIDISHLL